LFPSTVVAVHDVHTLLYFTYSFSVWQIQINFGYTSDLVQKMMKNLDLATLTVVKT